MSDQLVAEYAMRLFQYIQWLTVYRAGIVVGLHCVRGFLGIESWASGAAHIGVWPPNEQEIHKTISDLNGDPLN